ncbi:MAG: hypothetical protein LAT63_17390 [Marinobacter sp.]|nr:hypothetical protein [Marinobacter sp.]
MIDVEFITMSDVSRITREMDNTDKYRMKWGEDYCDRAGDLWSKGVECYSKKQVSGICLDDLIFISNYHYCIGPYLGSSEDPLLFFKWIFSEINKLSQQ